MSRRLLLVLAVLTLPCTAPAAGPAAAAEEGAARSAVPGAVRVGRDLYARYCASCHGSFGRGDGPAAAGLRVAPPDLTTLALRRGGEFPAAELARVIDGRFELASHGTREMPVWGTRLGEDVPETGLGEEFARGRISVLIEYLRSIQRGS